MKEKIVRYGKFNTSNGVEHCVAVVQYDDVLRYNYITNVFDKIGERIHGVYRVRGGLNYSKIHGITKCGFYKNIQSLIDDDLSTYRNIVFEFYEPVEI